jgi:hypothetical protein
VVPIRTLQNIALNPNFGGEVMVVGLGCEKLSPERLVPGGLGDAIVRMQDEAFDSFGAIVDPDPRRRQRSHQGLVRPLGHSQRSDAVQSRAGDLTRVGAA